ncbi:PDZ domain-containing protein [uncultured Serinicoccus sp.]|uniref:YlbL family protein n=1 Tax=uncultured Serinicoccus sp. TaxID=735514 RepID=UPI0026361A3B|nr:PDZ domain-containing protein [uncultured Serinicoccus sp.]
MSGDVQAGPEGRAGQPPHTRVGVSAAALLVVVAAGVLTGSVLNLVTVQRVIYVPGPVYDTLGQIDGADVVSVDDELTTYDDTDGHLYFTTIRLQGGPGDTVSAWEALRASIDPSTTVVPREEVFPEDVTAEQVREQNTELMQHSQDDAAVVALRAQGVQIDENVVVAQVIADAPADGVLEVEDEIVQVAGQEVSDTTAVRDQIQAVEPGEEVPVTVRRGGEEIELDVPTRLDEESGRTIVGVYLAPVYDNPYEVTIDAGNVGGPSAGLMFSLAVYDEITPGSLTGGRSIAGTGTITGDGTVGGIGGITQKMYAARDAGAEVFFAPSDNCAEVVGSDPGGLTVVPVGTFDDALEAIVELEESPSTSASELSFPTCAEALEDQAEQTG